ncbi:MAG: hypothetical protein ACP5GL_08595, partial [Infirmifilum sp.]
DGSAYPGEPINVTVLVNEVASYTVKLANDTTAGYTVWATQIFNPPTTGKYTITLTLPLSLPNLSSSLQSSSPKVYILLIEGDSIIDSKSLDIYPKIVVSPAETFVVDQNGNAKTATVNVYGVDPGATISSFTFTGPITDTYTLSTPITVENDGTGTATLTLSGTSFTKGLPRGTYTVTFGDQS